MFHLSDSKAFSITPIKKKYTIGGKEITFEAGKFGLLANGSVVISDNNGNVLLTTVVVNENPSDQKDFLPLTVEYQEKFYATGKIGGNRFVRREGKPSDTSILTARLIDRPIRPMFPAGFSHEIQIIATALSSSSESDLGFFGITGASLALMIAGVPFEGPVSGVRIVLNREGKYIFDPTFEEEETSLLNIVVAGTSNTITMIEAGAKEVSAKNVVTSLSVAHSIIQELCEAQKDFYHLYCETFGKEEFHYVTQELSSHPEYHRIMEYIEATIDEATMDTLYHTGKKEFFQQFDRIVETIKEKVYALYIQNTDSAPNEIAEGEICAFIQKCIISTLKKNIRRNILEKGKRLDGRGIHEIRGIKCETGLLPRVHGSGLFQRGMTQVLSVVTLGGPQDTQIIDDMYEETEKRFMHHYNFPPFSTGEIRPLKVGRREIGHGKLVEKAIEPVLPKEEQFPYIIRIVSETLTCNGSSSMASVCGCTLALMNAGVPIQSPVAGIGMGLIYDESTGKYVILSDIQAPEDFFGDMDCKIAMSPKGITAIQLDVKINGLHIDMFTEIFTLAQKHIEEILGYMLQAQPTIASSLSPYAPVIDSIHVPVDKIREIIGKGGENVQKIERIYQVKIHIEENGFTTITGKSKDNVQKAIEMIQEVLWEPSIGYKGKGTVVRILEGIGVIVEFKGKIGMIHISKLGTTKITNIRDIIQEGETVAFEVIEINKEKGRIELKKI